MASNLTPRPRLILITHEGGEFIARFNFTGDAAEAIDHACQQVTERFGLEVTVADIASQADVDEAQGQFTELPDA